MSKKRFSVDIAAHHSFTIFSSFLFLFCVPCLGDAKRRHLYIDKARLTLKCHFLPYFCLPILTVKSELKNIFSFLGVPSLKKCNFLSICVDLDTLS